MQNTSGITIRNTRELRELQILLAFLYLLVIVCVILCTSRGKGPSSRRKDESDLNSMIEDICADDGPIYQVHALRV